MGTSTDGILVYGIPLVEGAIPPYFDEAEPEEGEPDLSVPGVREWLALSDNEKAISRMMATCGSIDGIELCLHCSSDFSMVFAAIKDASYVAARGYPLQVTGLDLQRNIEWDKRLKAFVEKYGLETEGDGKKCPKGEKVAPLGNDRRNGGPGWYLASWWG